MTQLTTHSLIPSSSSPGRTAPLIHKWFARRRPEAIRSVLEGLDHLCEGQPLRIMDPFAGSGMILLESLTRGHDVFGIDINPVAWLIARQTLNPPEVKQVEKAFGSIDEAVGPTIRRMFSTRDPMGRSTEFVTGFYVRVIATPDGTEAELHHNYLIARNEKQNWAVYYCPSCGNVFYSTCLDTVTCTECQTEFLWRDGTISRGALKVRGATFKVAELYRLEVGGPNFRLIAIESYSPVAGRQFHRPSPQDHINIENAKLECLNNRIANRLCNTPIPTTRRDPRPISHGFTHYGQLFAPRQLMSLALIAESIKDIEDSELRYTMALALSDAVGSNNRMCRYAADWLKLTPAFGLHGFDVVTRPVEGNVWGAARGRGSFRNCVKKAMRAYDSIRGSIDDTQAFRNSPPQREVMCLPSQALSKLEWELMDAIVTDPPYFDNLDYGELSDLYYQWLRVALNGEAPFDRPYAVNDSDLAAIAGLARNPKQFSIQLGRILRQAADTLKTSGVMAFSYHHAKSQGWECLTEALRLANLAPYRIKFVRSELNNGFHSSTGNIKTDAIFYCRNRILLEDVSPADVISDAMGSFRVLDGIKPIDVTNANYAMAAALSALNPMETFEDSLERAKKLLGRD